MQPYDYPARAPQMPSPPDSIACRLLEQISATPAVSPSGSHRVLVQQHRNHKAL